MKTKRVKVTLSRKNRFALYKLKKENKLQETISKWLECLSKKVFGTQKATIHTPLKEKDLYYLDLLAEEQNKRRYEIIKEALYNLPAYKKIQKKHSLFDM